MLQVMISMELTKHSYYVNLIYRVWPTPHPSKPELAFEALSVQGNRPEASEVLGWDWRPLLLASQNPKLPDTWRTVWLWASFPVCCQCTRNMVEVALYLSATEWAELVSDPRQLSVERFNNSSPSGKAHEWNLFEKEIHVFSWLRVSKYGL